MKKTTAPETHALIPHKVEDAVINQRATDGYINATAMCQVHGKLVGDYLRLGSTDEFLNELSTVMGIPIDVLVIKIQGGKLHLRGTWVHPKVAVNLAQWCSPKFAVAVSVWIDEWMNGTRAYHLPLYLQRLNLNRMRIPPTHFCVMQQLWTAVIGPLEHEGYIVRDDMLPDGSEGKFFARWVRDVKGIDTSKFPDFNHKYPDGRAYPAKLYPISLLPDFIEHVHNEWLPNEAARYFAERDEAALPYLSKAFPTLTFEPPKKRITKSLKSKNTNLSH